MPELYYFIKEAPYDDEESSRYVIVVSKDWYDAGNSIYDCDLGEAANALQNVGAYEMQEGIFELDKSVSEEDFVEGMRSNGYIMVHNSELDDM